MRAVGRHQDLQRKHWVLGECNSAGGDVEGSRERDIVLLDVYLTRLLGSRFRQAADSVDSEHALGWNGRAIQSLQPTSLQVLNKQIRDRLQASVTGENLEEAREDNAET